MKIIVDGKQAVMKEGSSFEYHSENPLFTDAEDYSLEIEFPMKDCPQNILIFGALHVKGVDISRISFPCEIITESFDKTGILAITEVGSVMVKGQFLEGMSQQNFSSALPSTYITDIDFSDYDGSDRSSTSVNRVMGSGWDNMIVWDKKKGCPIYRTQSSVNFGAGWTSRHIYLYHLAALIAQKCGYTLDDTVLRTIPMYTKICVVNTVYCVVDTGGDYAFPSLARALPHWTVKEFFEEMGNFFGCVYEIDAINSVIKFSSYKQLSSTGVGGAKVNLTVIDDFEVEMSDEEAKYKGNVKYKIASDSDPDKVNCCTWLNGKRWLYDYSQKTLQEMKGLLQAAAWSDGASVTELNYRKSIYHITDKNVDLVPIKYTKWNSEGYDESSQGHPEYLFCEFEPLGLYGNLTEGEELGIAPCPLKMKQIFNKPTTDGDPGSQEITAPYAYRMPVISIPQDDKVEFYNNDNEPVREIMDVIKDGEQKEIEYFKQLWVVIHSGTMDQRGYYLNTRKIEPGEDATYASFFKTDWRNKEGNNNFPLYNCEVTEHSYNLCPSDPSIKAISSLPQVDESKLYRYKFLSKTLPDPKAIYIVKGKEYACLRLTAHFNVDGMSELIEGEFYEIAG